jgi:hypothetical protein
MVLSERPAAGGERVEKITTTPSISSPSPVVLRAEEMRNLAPNLDNNMIALGEIYFATEYLVFWEMHRGFVDEMVATGKLPTNLDETIKLAMKRVAVRFHGIFSRDPYNPELEMFTLEDLNAFENFFGSIFQSYSVNGLNLFTDWLKSTDGRVSLQMGVMHAQLKIATSDSEPSVDN